MKIYASGITAVFFAIFDNFGTKTLTPQPPPERSAPFVIKLELPPIMKGENIMYDDEFVNARYIIPDHSFDKKGEPSRSLAYYQIDLEKEPMPLLEEEEEKALLQRYKDKQDPQARDKLIKSHLKMVVGMAKRLCGMGNLLEDLVSSGNVALIEAVDRSARTELTTRFYNFAWMFISRAMINVLYGNFHACHLPKDICNTIVFLRRRYPNVDWREVDLERIMSDIYMARLTRFVDKYGSLPREEHRRRIQADVRWSVTYARDFLANETFRKEDMFKYYFEQPKAILPSQEDMIEYSETSAIVQSCLERLPANQKEIMIGYIKGKTSLEMAEERMREGDDLKKVQKKIIDVIYLVSKNLWEMVSLKNLDGESSEEVINTYVVSPGNWQETIRRRIVEEEIARRLRAPEKLSDQELVKFSNFRKDLALQRKKPKIISFLEAAEKELQRRLGSEHKAERLAEVEQLAVALNKAPKGHPDRIRIMRTFAQLGLPIVVGRYGVIPHRSLASNSGDYYTVSPKSVIIRKGGKIIQTLACGNADVAIQAEKGEIYVLVTREASVASKVTKAA